MADGVLITGLRPVRIQVDPEFTPQIFVSSTRQRERLVDQAGGDFDLDPPIVDRRRGSLCTRISRQASDRVLEAYRIPTPACQIRSGGVGRGILPAKQP